MVFDGIHYWGRHLGLLYPSDADDVLAIIRTGMTIRSGFRIALAFLS